MRRSPSIDLTPSIAPDDGLPYIQTFRKDAPKSRQPKMLLSIVTSIFIACKDFTHGGVLSKMKRRKLEAGCCFMFPFNLDLISVGSCATSPLYTRSVGHVTERLPFSQLRKAS